MISKGNHVKFARFMLLPVREEARTWLPFFFCFVQCIKQLLDSFFVISRVIKISVRIISLSLRLRLITPTSTLIILDITKTSSNVYYMDLGDYLDSPSYLEDMTCNLDDTFQVLCQMQQMNHLDISCSLCPHSRECQRKNPLKKDKNNVNLRYATRCIAARLYLLYMYSK